MLLCDKEIKKIVLLLALNGDIVLIMTIRGTHGTCGSRAKVILRNGFNLDKCGETRYNRGVYLWDYSHPLKIQLAEDWYKVQLRKRKYEGEKDKACTILICKLEIDKDEHLNMDENDFKIKLHTLVVAHNIQIFNDDIIRGLYETVVRTIEDVLEREFKVLSARVSPPDTKTYSLALYSSPSCFIVRKTTGMIIAENV